MSALLRATLGLNSSFYSIYYFLSCLHGLPSSPELEVEFWELGKFYEPLEDGAPPVIIPASWIQCQLARGVAHLVDFWVTTSLQRVSHVVHQSFAIF